MWNPYKRLSALTAGPRSDVGQVMSVEGDGVVVALAAGPQVKARGTAAVGDWVYLRGGVIEGPAPDLAGTTIEV